MEHFFSLRLKVRLYVTAVVAVGALTLAMSVHRLWTEPIGSDWLLLACLTILTGSFSVKVPSINAYISVSEAFVFASVLLYGAEAGTVTVLLECLVILLWMKPQGRPAYRMFFNMAAPSVAIWTAGQGFYWLSGIVPYSRLFTPLPQLFVPLLSFTAAYFLLNSWLVAFAVGLETQKSAAQIWLKNFAWLSVNYFSGASLAALIVTYTERLDFSTLAVIVPLLVVSYLTFRTAMGRAEDSYNHLSELNRLYLSTIETLAMAIDAKDQITHGHIRRVQLYAVGLAKQMGITDDSLLKAIEAAALLHDMGKLAVPEHILNKPGKLTPAEFEKMKLHAGVGADILSAIDFPYPVVPIVRHHHENWDGTGYPSGIRGVDIPIGARILSVVDCFDALTSDRPYRPRLADEEALAILVERRGTMYDPLVVDTFLRVHRSIAPEQLEPKSVANALAEITTASIAGRGDPIELATSNLLDLDLSSIVSSEATEADQDSSVLPALETRYDLALLFRYNPTTDELAVETVIGTKSPDVRSMRIQLGERLSGWVGANQSTILNSDPALDFAEVDFELKASLTRALSVPILDKGSLLGVLSLYRADDFTENDRAHVQRVALLLASRLTGGGEDNGSGNELPKASPSALAPAHAVIWIDIPNWADVCRLLGASTAQLLMRDVVIAIKRILGPADMLPRYRENEFVALRARAEAKDIRELSRSIRSSVSQVASAHGTALEVTVDVVIAPVGSDAIRELLGRDISQNLTPGGIEPRERVH